MHEGQGFLTLEIFIESHFKNSLKSSQPKYGIFVRHGLLISFQLRTFNNYVARKISKMFNAMNK
jgi:hypothetical protein